MYTVVLLTAMTAGNTTPDFFFRSGGCHGCSGYTSGCHGCWGGCHGCYGTTYYGCQGVSCHGCYGGGCHGGGLLDCFRNLFGCHGCNGGCYGCSGCYGSYYGCSGCYGNYYGCSGCYGGTYSNTTPVFYPPGTTGGQPEVVPPPKKDKSKEPKLEQNNKIDQVHATVTIDVPADGKLYIDGTLMKTGSGRRTFQSPALNPGQLYYYDVRVEIVRNGKTVADTQRVILRPGQLVTSSFAHLETRATEAATAQAGQQ